MGRVRSGGVVGPAAPRGWSYAGTFLVALATLMFEVLLTRIFSVTMYYHFAFVAISVAMFGMTAGAVLVRLLPGVFPLHATRSRVVWSAILFALTSVAAFALHVSMPAMTAGGAQGLGAVAPTYVVMAVPFTFSGIAICLMLTRYPGRVGLLYAADLSGAAIGCLALILTLRLVDGPTAVAIVALLAALGGVCLAMEAERVALRRAAAIAAGLLAIFTAAQVTLAPRGAAPLQLFWAKGLKEPRFLYDRWNSFSRVTVRGNPQARRDPTGWGPSPVFTPLRKVSELYLAIDSTAGSPLTRYTRDPGQIEHLRYDIVNLAHYLRSGADVLVVGAGGGRDILSAFAFEQRSVVAIEVNENIIDAVTGPFGDFTGHLEADRRVRLINDEARSWAARQDDRWDIIQISLIDTWAATSAGAFVLTENSLYTVEAWKTFLRRLTPRGVLTITRWYFEEQPSEMYRVVSLAAAALRGTGVTDPRGHVLIARRMFVEKGKGAPEGVATILVGRERFTGADVSLFEQTAGGLGFELVLTPRWARDRMFEDLVSARGAEEAITRHPLDISPTTDDRPFFFHMLRLRDVFDAGKREALMRGPNRIQLQAVAVLGTLLVVVSSLTLACIVLPLVIARQPGSLAGAAPLLVYFCGIGLGFMLVEISQMQRLVVFLGHPTYALSVVLFALLGAGGAGSWATQWIGEAGLSRRGITALACLLGALVVLGAATPFLTASLEGASTPVRIAAGTALLLVLGFFMGMPFPLGMRLAGPGRAGLTAWLWGVNGATSVLASVLAVVIALAFGISGSYWTGTACYALSLLAFLWAARPAARAAGPVVYDAGGEPACASPRSPAARS